MKLFAKAKFLCSLISGRPGAAPAGRLRRMSHRSRKTSRAVPLSLRSTRNGFRNLPHDTTSEESQTSPYSLAVAFSSSKRVLWTRIR